MVAPGGNPDKATIREVHELLTDLAERDSLVHAIIMDKLDDVCLLVGRQDERVLRNAIEIEKLRERSTISDIVISVGAAIAAIMAAVIGWFTR